MENTKEIISYDCPCGITISDKSRSLKQHLNTKRHLSKVDACPPHYWSIDPANGPTSMGVCSKCAAAKHFDNSLNTGGGWFLQMADEKAQKDTQEMKELERLVT
jgi:hypothetical protein